MLAPLRMTFKARLASGLVALALTACSGSNVEVQAGSGAEGGGQAAASGFSTLVKSIERAPWMVPYEGIRRMDYLREVPSLSYREMVAGDGNGGFQLKNIEVLSMHPDLNGITRRLEQTKGFQYRFKDFRVQDAYLFQLAYKIRILTKDEIVAGITCTRIFVERQLANPNMPLADQPNHFLVDFDPATGLVLRWTELDSFGVKVASMEFEQISYGAPSIEMHPPTFREIPLQAHRQLDEQAGFSVLRPTLLPANYRLEAASLVDDGSNNPWVRQVYTDGLKVILLMHRGKAQTAGVHASTLGAFVDGDRTMLVGEVNGYEILAEGSQELLTMQDMVSSCFK